MCEYNIICKQQYLYFKDNQTLDVGLLNLLCMQFNLNLNMKFEIIRKNTGYLM